MHTRRRISVRTQACTSWIRKRERTGWRSWAATGSGSSRPPLPWGTYLQKRETFMRGSRRTKAWFRRQAGRQSALTGDNQARNVGVEPALGVFGRLIVVLAPAAKHTIESHGPQNDDQTLKNTHWMQSGAALLITVGHTVQHTPLGLACAQQKAKPAMSEGGPEPSMPERKGKTLPHQLGLVLLLGRACAQLLRGLRRLPSIHLLLRKQSKRARSEDQSERYHREGKKGRQGRTTTMARSCTVMPPARHTDTATDTAHGVRAEQPLAVPSEEACEDKPLRNAPP